MALPREAYPQCSLTDTVIRAAKPAEKPRKLFDEKGLYLVVMPSGGRLCGDLPPPERWPPSEGEAPGARVLSRGGLPDASSSRRDAAQSVLSGIHKGRQSDRRRRGRFAEQREQRGSAQLMGARTFCLFHYGESQTCHLLLSSDSDSHQHWCSNAVMGNVFGIHHFIASISSVRLLQPIISIVSFSSELRAQSHCSSLVCLLCARIGWVYESAHAVRCSRALVAVWVLNWIATRSVRCYEGASY
jgi:hypothetical protein